MSETIDAFRDQILTSGIVLDPAGVHHEFSSGAHGKKLDFDNIPDDSPLFRLWVASAVSKIQSLYTPEELDGATILSVANGTNRVVQPVASRLGRSTVALLSEKTTPKAVALNTQAKRHIKIFRPKLTVVLEDVGTSGGTTLSAVESALAAGASRVEPLITWQRRAELKELAARGIVYHAIIKEQLEEFSPDDCVRIGYCSKGETLIERPTVL